MGFVHAASTSLDHIQLKDRDLICLINWEERPQTFSFKLSGPSRLTDHWTGESLSRHEGTAEIKEVPKHSARLLVCERASH